jgi:hypothetical protein
VDLAADCTYTFTEPDASTESGGSDYDFEGPDAFDLVNTVGAVTINGNGSTIARASGSPDFLFFDIGNDGTLTLNDVTLEGGKDDNEGSAGAVLATGEDSILTVNNSAFIDDSGRSAGAISSYSNIYITDSTFSGNSSPWFGAVADQGDVTKITNSTFVDNTSERGTIWGGIENTTIQGSTFVDDVVTTPGYPVVLAGNGTISGSIFADGPDALECGKYYQPSYLSYDVFETSSAAVTENNPDVGYNPCGFGSSDEFGVSASALGLGALQANGAGVSTVGIGPGSAAYHFVPAADCPATDERGVARPQPPASVQGSSAFCDAGAFEYLPASIAWATPAAIPYGTALTTSQLDASAADTNGDALPGTFTYSPAAGTVPGDPGVYQLGVTFTPTGDSLYGTTTATVPMTVEKAGTSLAAATTAGSQSLTFVAALTRSDDDAGISGQTIVFSAQGQNICAAITTSSGAASCTVKGIAVPAGAFTASFAGDSDYLASSATGQSAGLVSSSSSSSSMPSNSFSVLSKKISKTDAITLGVLTHAPGVISATATFTETIKHTTGTGKHKKTRTTHKTLTYGTAKATSAAGHLSDLTIKASRTAAKLLKEHQTLHLKLTVHFTPTGGTMNQLVLSSTVKAPKAKH